MKLTLIICLLGLAISGFALRVVSFYIFEDGPQALSASGPPMALETAMEFVFTGIAITLLGLRRLSK